MDHTQSRDGDDDVEPMAIDRDEYKWVAHCAVDFNN